jgi:site-specific DNA-methyltransferase (adenine-specific)
VNDLKATNVESLFGLMDEAIKLLQTEAELSYIEALSETLENLSFEGKAQQVEGLPSNEAVERLNSLYKKMNLDALDKEIIRKSIQLTFIKATKEDKLQMNHQMTPDTIAYLIAYFIGEIKKDKTEKLHVSDLAAGTGNLLNIVRGAFGQQGK